MTREDLYEYMTSGPVILDGATGSNLQKAGMPAGVCPELWVLEHEEVLIHLQESFVDAGTRILYAPTFSGNRVKLAEYGLYDRAEEINGRLVSLSKKAARGRALVAGNMTMTGDIPEPYGSRTLEEFIDIYKEQARFLLKAGVDLFVVETMMSLAEARAAVIAIKEICDLPVMVSMTFEEDGRTLYGTDCVTAAVVLQSIGADVIGANCSTGPAQMLPILRRMKEYADVPLLAKPNAGLPILVDDVTVYPMEPEEFASFGPAFVEAGVGFIGGCCGTTPAHVALLAQKVRGMTVLPPDNRHPSMLASERKSQEIRPDGNFLIIGERINPTGKKKLQEELRAGSFRMVQDMAEEQERMGAHILDINVGTGGIDETAVLTEAIKRVGMVSNLPLSIDTSSVKAMEAALRNYPGRALVNSVSMETQKVEKLLPLVKKYGAMFILLPLSDKGLPDTAGEKKELIHGLLKKARQCGIDENRIIADGLVTTVGANKKAALETLETIRYCREELNLCTVAGLSNISFGLPERAYVNSAFVSMAIADGLTMAIANPSDPLLMGISFAADMLQNKKEADRAYIEQVDRMAPLMKKPEAKTAAPSGAKTEPSPDALAGAKTEPSPDAETQPLYQAVLKGKEEGVEDLVTTEIRGGTSPKAVLNDILIPAINEVGRRFDTQEYFLPQLIAGAGTMKKAIDVLEPFLEEGTSRADKPVIVIATVEGDIHDIGKNLVALMFKNYGYQVVDLGKDVPADTIIEAAREQDAAIICLSALMTTTMLRMKDTINLRNKEKLQAKVIIGGAVTTPEYAEEIGADGYSKDAAEAVRLVQSLLEETV